MRAFVFVVLAACGSPAPEVSTPLGPATAPVAEAPGEAPASALGVTGKVQETMDSGGYTYLKLDVAGREVWAAVPQAAVQVGQTVTLLSPTTMHGFQSKTLNRTWDEILFATLDDGGAAAAPPAAPMGAPASAPVAVGPVAKADGPDGRTVAEVFAQKAALSGKTVAVRGTVVKATNGVMGKNWLHVQDGTGEAGSNDLTVTTNASVEKGATVLVRGVLATDKDFGAGYAYTAIVEDATVTP